MVTYQFTFRNNQSCGSWQEDSKQQREQKQKDNKDNNHNSSNNTLRWKASTGTTVNVFFIRVTTCLYRKVAQYVFCRNPKLHNVDLSVLKRNVCHTTKKRSRNKIINIKHFKSKNELNLRAIYFSLYNLIFADIYKLSEYIF